LDGSGLAECHNQASGSLVYACRFGVIGLGMFGSLHEAGQYSVDATQSLIGCQLARASAWPAGVFGWLHTSFRFHYRMQIHTTSQARGNKMDSRISRARLQRA
jgi:hypothetical protein